MSLSADGAPPERRASFSLVLGLIVFTLLVILPLGGLPPPVRRMMAVAALMAIWWVGEAMPLAATSLLPLVLLPSLGIASAAEAAAPYANHLVFLFMGGFMLAQAMQRWNLHRRIALTIVLWVGSSPSGVVLGFMCASAFISMWVSNTATTAMMMPIGLAVIQQVSEAAQKADAPEGGRRSEIDFTPGRFRFGVNLMLGIAYGASIGGVGTLIGTPPNVFLAGAMSDRYGIELGFGQWLAFGLPFVALFIPLTWLWMTRVAFPIEIQSLPGGRELIRTELNALGRMGRGETRVALLFGAAALAWTFRPIWTRWIPNGELVTDSTVAIAAAVLAFLTPVRGGERLLDWEWASKLPWHVLVLFGGGFSLAMGFEKSGLAEWVGQQLRGFADAPLPLFIGLVVLLIISLTEFASNMASTAMAIPILAATAIAMGLSPLVLCVPATVAASCAFMLPAATPPNAIVFGTGYFTIAQMVKAGVWINAIGILLTTLFALLLVGPIFGL